MTRYLIKSGFICLDIYTAYTIWFKCSNIKKNNTYVDNNVCLIHLMFKHVFFNNIIYVPIGFQANKLI